MNKFRQDVRDAWLSGMTPEEIIQNNARMLSLNECSAMYHEWTLCERKFKVAENIIRHTAKR